MAGEKARPEWRRRLAERLRDRRQRRAWRRERRKHDSSELGGVEPLESSKYPGGSFGPAGKQQGGGYPGY